MSSFAIFGATVFGGTICFLMGFISGRIWQQHIDRPVSNPYGLVGGSHKQAAQQAAGYWKPVKGMVDVQGSPYPQGQQYRMGDWDKGQQE